MYKQDESFERKLKFRDETFYMMRDKVTSKEPSIKGSRGNDNILDQKTDELLKLFEDSGLIDHIIENSFGIDKLRDRKSFVPLHTLSKTLSKLDELRSTSSDKDILDKKECLLEFVKSDIVSSLKLMR